MSAHPDLTTFKALSFDCYGTLIDWETGMLSALSPLLSQLPASHPFVTTPSLAVQRCNVVSNELEAAHPTMLYSDLLAATYRQMATELGVPEASDADVQGLARGPGEWRAFADTVRGLNLLAKHYKLIILSNVDNANIARATGPGGGLDGAAFDAVYTAQDIGAYKPSFQNFFHLWEHATANLGVDAYPTSTVRASGAERNAGKGELLHVARSLTHDHVPCAELGQPSVWISRGGHLKGGDGAGGSYEELSAQEGRLAFEWRFDTIGEFADEVERQFKEKEGK